MSGSCPLDLPQINAITDALTCDRDRAAFLLACGCGLRSGSLLSLTLAQVLDRDHRLTGRVEIPKRKMKGRRAAHTVDIPARALRALALWIAAHPAPHRAAPLFPSARDPTKPLVDRQWRRIVSAAASRAGIAARVTPHSARKFFAHAIYEGTSRDIQLTTRALGNKSPMATLHYLDFGQRRIRAATLEIFDAQTHPELDLPTTESPFTATI